MFGIKSLNLSIQCPGTAPSTLGLIIGGALLLAFGAVYEVKTSREALFPPQLFKDISCGIVPPFCLTKPGIHEPTVAILIVVFLHSFCFTTGTFYIAIYFQVRSRRNLRSGFANLTHRHQLGRERDDPIIRGDSYSSLFTGVHTHLLACCMAYWLLANKTGEYEWSKVDIVRGLDHRCRWLRCVYQ